VDGLTLLLIAVVVLTVVILAVTVEDLPDQIHNPVEFRGVGRAAKLVAAAAVLAWVLGMFVF
jgi:diacylglycerol kinase